MDVGYNPAQGETSLANIVRAIRDLHQHAVSGPPGYGQFVALVNGMITASVGSNALTLAVKTHSGNDPSPLDKVRFAFRSSTLATGDVTVIEVAAALSITVPASATLGHVSSRDQQIILYAINNAGTVELAVSCSMSDQSVRRTTTTTISAASTISTTVYSTTGRSNVAWYPIARLVSNQATAGTWTAVPTQIDLAPFTLPTNFFYANRSANQTIATTTFTKVQFNANIIDPDSCYDGVTNFRFQPKVPGKYSISYVIFWLPGTFAAGNQTVGTILKNGAEVARLFNQFLGGNQGTGGGSSFGMDMNGTSDFLEIFVYQDSGANQTLSAASAAFNGFTGVRVAT